MQISFSFHPVHPQQHIGFICNQSMPLQSYQGDVSQVYAQQITQYERRIEELEELVSR